MSVTRSSYAESSTVIHPLQGLPRLLAEMPAHGAMSLSEHRALHGQLPVLRTRRRAHSGLIDELEQAGLRGRGGAGFPTAKKLQAVAASRGRPVIVVNAAEGEPASHKDRILTRALPHLVLDGGELAAQALGANELIVSVCESALASAESLAAAIAERGMGARRSPHVRVVTVPDRYVAGQETALIAHLNGAPALPTFTPPMPFQRGVGRHPTLLSNAETFAHIALIARHGARWFRQLGTVAQPGSALVTLSGCVALPGVYEIEYGTPLLSLIDAAGGMCAAPRALLLGGYGGSWVDAEHLSDLVLCDEHLEPYGASLGAGVIALLSERACPIGETARIARWLADQSAGQCGPCVHGLDALASALEGVTGQRSHDAGGIPIDRLLLLVRRRGACAHPDGAARLVQSALVMFEDELMDHARHGACECCPNLAELPLAKLQRRPRAQLRG